MNPVEHDNVLFRLLSLNKIKIYEVTDFRMTKFFKDLPQHIRAALIDYWETN